MVLCVERNIRIYMDTLIRFSFLLFISLLAVQMGCEEQGKKKGLCTSLSIPVKLEEGANEDHYIRGQLCWKGELSSKSTQVLLHGAGYGPIYWDFPYKPEIYSYVKAALDRDYAVFNFARLGVEKSTIPPAEELTIERDAFVVHQIIGALREFGEQLRQPLGHMMTVGHSMGSVVAMAHAIQYPDDIDGLILTGFIHHVNADYVRGNIAMQVQAEDDPRFNGRELGSGYISSTAASRLKFYEPRHAEQAVIDLDYQTREPVSLTEIFGIQKYYSEGAELLIQPTLQVIGDRDYIGCGTSLDNVVLDCSDHGTLITREKQRFSPQTCLETVVIPEAGHVLNLQLQASYMYQIIFDWIERRLGTQSVEMVDDPCLPDEYK